MVYVGARALYIVMPGLPSPPDYHLSVIDCLKSAFSKLINKYAVYHTPNFWITLKTELLYLREGNSIFMCK